jgi:hypothetical protein
MVEVDRDMYRTSRGVGAEWSRSYQWQQLALFGQWAQQRHTMSERLRDVDLLLAGAGWSYDLMPGKTRLSVSAYLADEAAVESSFDYFGRSYLGSRLALLWRAQQQYELQFSWSQQRSKYDASHPVFGKQREESFSQLVLEWNWRFEPRWHLGLGFSHVSNRSNLDIYTYGKTQEYFSLGYDF